MGIKVEGNGNGESRQVNPVSLSRAMGATISRKGEYDHLIALKNILETYLEIPPLQSKFQPRSKERAMADYMKSRLQVFNVEFLREWNKKFSITNLHPDRCVPFLELFIDQVLIEDSSEYVRNRNESPAAMAPVQGDFEAQTAEEADKRRLESDLFITADKRRERWLKSHPPGGGVLKEPEITRAAPSSNAAV